MAGHSHWANIQHKKARVDAKKGKVLSKIARLIISACRQGGGDPDSNLKLRYALEKARQASMPKDTIERAIKRGTGALGSGNDEELLYEGYGPNGVAIMLDVLTDNRNRTAPEIKKIFDTHGGSLGATGCVAWMFDKQGLFLVNQSDMQEEKLMELALEAGAQDVELVGEHYQIKTSPADFLSVKERLEAMQVPFASAEVTQIPKTVVKLDEVPTAKKVLSLMEELENHDDVQQTYANFDIPEDVMQEISK